MVKDDQNRKHRICKGLNPGGIALTENGDEIVVEESGEPRIKIVPITKTGSAKRVAGLGKGYWMSDDFDDELPDEFWGFDTDL